jgi:hypothetical protein
MPGPTLDHVQIAAPPGCEPAARHFFGGLLGLSELDDLAARLSAADFPITWDTALPTERRFYSADPWGNRIEFLAEAD